MSDLREPAFPTLIDLAPGDVAGNRIGLTVRDWFAGQAINGLLSGPGDWGSDDHMALRAYEIADAMLGVR